MTLDEFIVKLGVSADVNQAKAFREQLTGITKAASVATAAIAGLAAGVTAWLAKSLDGLDALNQVSRETGESVEFIQRLGYAADMSGASVEAATGSIRGMTKAIGEAAAGVGRGAPAFEKYGLHAKNADDSVKQFSEVLGDVQDKMARMSKAEQGAFLSKIGIDPSMVQVLRMSREELQGLFAEADAWGVSSAEQADAASEWKDQITDLAFGFDALRTQIAIGLLPRLKEFIGNLKEFLRTNRQVVQNGINRFIGLVYSAGQVLVNLFRFIAKVTDGIGGMRVALLLVGAALAWFKRASLLAFATNPVFWLVAAIGVLLLLIDDFMTYLDGGEAEFGEFWETLREPIAAVRAEIGAFIRDLKRWWAEHGETVMAIAGELWDYLRLGFAQTVAVIGAVLGQLWDLFSTAFGLMADLIDWFVAFITGDFEAAGAIVGRMLNRVADLFIKTFTRIGDFVRGTIERIKSYFPGVGALIEKTLGAVARFFGGGTVDVNATGADAGAIATAARGAAAIPRQVQSAAAGAAPAARAQPGTTTNRTVNANVTNNTTMHVQADDPEAAARAVQDRLDQQNRAAVQNAASAVVG
ncbi:tail tape measure protein TP901 core region [Paraburkholderia atlantica]|uniref:Tail tape measure protein TP901 core region n=1 Tax=Paraburkholderia atlantica TaxID=2654982 RepID=D5WMF1_PARAM|nr:tail tape measure protein TP901 core region [Paraburkholderia atlantica]ADG20397.1 tail tape measure protein TP901 core region [Paraburkholderia atlantica]